MVRCWFNRGGIKLYRSPSELFLILWLVSRVKLGFGYDVVFILVSCLPSLYLVSSGCSPLGSFHVFIILSFLFSLGVWEVWYIEVVGYMGEFMNSSFMNEWLKFIVWLGIVVLMFGLYGFK